MLPRLVVNAVFVALLTSSGVALEQNAANGRSETFEHLVLVAPAARGSDWDAIARSMQSSLISSGFVKQVDVQDVPGSHGIDGLIKFSAQYGHDGNALLITGRALIETASLSTVLSKVVPVACLTGDFKVIPVPAAGDDIQGIDRMVPALKAKPTQLPHVPLEDLTKQGTDLSFANWQGVFAPAGVSHQERDALIQLMFQMEKSPKWREDLHSHLWSDTYIPGDDFTKFLMTLPVVSPANDPLHSPKQQMTRDWRIQIWVIENRKWLLIALVIATLAIGAIIAVLRIRSSHRERTLQHQLVTVRQDADKQLAETSELLRGVSIRIDNQLIKWGLTDAEQEVAWLLIKGLRHKEISSMRNTTERTVRQQAVCIYRKAGINGRTELVAYFMEDLLQPMMAHPLNRFGTLR